MKKSLIIGNHPYPVKKTLSNVDVDRIILHTDLSKSIPITTKAITSLTNTYDEIVFQLPIQTNDQLIQGERLIINEFVLRLFVMVMKDTNTKLHIQIGNKLSLMNDEFISSTLENTLFSSIHPSNSPSKYSVTSIQKWQTTSFSQANEVANHYYSWLGPFTKKVIKVIFVKDEAHFRIANSPYSLLVLKKVPQVSANISEWEIKSGLLNKSNQKKKASHGRLWFIVNDVQQPFAMYSALTHFRPALPWPIYRLTQSILHPFVMNQFKKCYLS